MYSSSRTTKCPDRAQGFSLIELLVVIVVTAVLLLAFTGFYVSQQRAARRNEVEIETSQSLRTALEQMSRDIRLIGRDITRAPGFTRFNNVTATDLDFNIDTNDDGTGERNRFRLNGSTIEKCDGNAGTNCNVLADFITALTFNYLDCGGTAVASPNASTENRNKIGRIDVSLTVGRGRVSGTTITRTEVDSITLRNLCN